MDNNEIINETINREGNPNDNLAIVIKSILNDNIAVYSDDSTGKAIAEKRNTSATSGVPGKKV